jgi:hypothetical protein
MAEDKPIEITDSDVLSCTLGYYLYSIQQKRTDKTEIDKRRQKIDNIFYITKDPQKDILTQEYIKELPVLSNRITRKDGEQKLCELDIFNSFSKNQLFFNQAVPNIQLFKIFKTNEGKYVELDIPFDIVAGQKKFEVPYKQNNFVEKFLEGGSGNAIGLTNFAWKSEGKNEGNNTIFTVDFKIILQSISELETVRNTDKESGMSVTLLDLLYPSVNKNREFISDPAAFEPEQTFIKANVGWSMPIGYESYKDFFQTSLYLHLYKHNFTFHDSGKVELGLTYIGNIETIFNDKTKYDIFMSTRMQVVSEIKTTLEQVKSIPESDKANRKSLIIASNKLTQKLDSFLTIDPNRQKAVNEGRQLLFFSSFFGGARGLRVLDPTNSNIDQYLEYLNKEVIGKNKINFFNKILNKLISEKLIYTFNFEKEEFEKFKSLISAENINSTTLEGLKKSSADLNKKSRPQTGVPEGNPDLEDGVKEDSSANRYVIDYEEMYDELNNPALFTDLKYVNFVYLDDLVRAVLENSEFDNKDINIFFGPYSYRDYRTIANLNSQVSKRPLQKTYINNKPKYYRILEVDKKVGQLGHIPISLNVLINWYNEEVIKSDETGYSFFEFLKKCFNTLIPESIGSKNAPNAPEQNILTNNLMFNGTKESFKSINLQSSQNGSSFVSYEEANKYYNKRTSPINTEKNYKNIYYLSSAEDDMSLFKGEETEDCNLDVLHLRINDFKNIIKKANFRRDDNQKLETANLLAANSTEGNKIIRQVYHCDLQMFGNNFFEPGNLIYIKPNYPGVNLSMDILFKIGLGGYYRVIKTENDIGVGSFTTTVNCRWEMFGGGINPLDIVNPAGISEEDILLKVE